jgi:hypothetical protein
MSSKIGPHKPLDPLEDIGDDGFNISWDSGFYVASHSQFVTPPAQFQPASTVSPIAVAVPVEAIEAQAAQNGSGGTGSVVAEASSGGGLTINLIFDAAAMAAPASFRAGIEQAAAILSSAISDKITINFNIDYSGTGGGAAAGPDNGLYESYSTVRADLINNATAGDTSFNALPAGSTIQGQSAVAVWNAQLKLWGFLGANDTTTDDGSATFATDISSNLLVGVALHELTHAMGRAPYGAPYSSSPDVFDFYRFTSPGTRLFSGSLTAPAAYFSLDGGTTKIADYGQTSDPSDFLNSGVQGPNDPFNEYYSGSTLQTLTAIDLKQLDALGFHLVGSSTPPTLTVSSISGVAGGQQLALSSLVTITDSTHVGYQKLELYDSDGTVAGGQFVINGVAQTGGHEIDVTPANVASTVFDTGTAAGSDLLYAQLMFNDGTLSGWKSFTVNSTGIPEPTIAVQGDPAVTGGQQAASLPSDATSQISIAFDGTTLTLNFPSTFDGQIVGFTGDGEPTNSDQIDLRGLNYISMHSNFDSSSGVLAVSDGQTAANLQFLGQYAQDNFHFADDGNGGTIVYAAPSSGGATNQIYAIGAAGSSSIGEHDNFVFASNFGQATIANFAPATDTIEFGKTVFANVNAFLAATHDDPSGNAVITDAAHDTITIQHITTAQLIAHQGDFHFV